MGGKAMFCALCGADNPNDGRYCSKCGTVLQGQRGMPPPGSDYGTFATPYSGPTETSGTAIGSLICGFLCFFFPSAVIAIILGHLSLSDIRKSGGRLTGSGMATAGLVLGYMGIAVIPVVLIVAAIAIPNLLRARIAANEASAVGSLRTIVTADLSYQETYSNGYAPSLAALDGVRSGEPSCDHAQLLGSSYVAKSPLPGNVAVLVAAQRNGYRFAYLPTLPPNGELQRPSPEAARKSCSIAGATGFEVHADPITRGTTGQRSFYADETGVIRYNVDGPATADSPVLQ
jgi:type IV pilus assembly protein PilA